MIAAEGIERRNKIHQIETLLRNAEALLEEALRITSED